MAYTKHTWVDNQSPAINATHLNEMETGIYDAHTAASNAQTTANGKYTKPSGGIPTSDLAIASDATSQQVRKIYAGTTEMTPGSTALATGMIYCMYE